MQITIDLEEGSSTKSITLEAAGHELIETIAKRAAEAFELDSDAVLDGTDAVIFHMQDSVADCIRHGHRWRTRRVCVEVSYQSDGPIRRVFNPRQPWRHVHEWACRQFNVAASMCQDLELFEGSPTGPVLNENTPIGRSASCKTVWLGKLGAEANG